MDKIKLLPSRVERIRLDLVDRDPRQPRKVFPEEGLKKLAANIQSFGFMIYAILVKPHPEVAGRYIVIAGERRFRALQFIGVEEFDFHVAEGEVPSYLISLIENDNREDLNPIDEAEAYKECTEREKMSVAELAGFTGKNVNDIYRALRLLKLPFVVKEMIREGKLRRGAAHNLAQFKGYAKQIELAQKLIAGEDPPELDEQLTKASDSSEARIIARLPETAEGLIRRMLQFRLRSNAVPFVIRAFLDLPTDRQVEGWRHFTKATRWNFASQLQELRKSLRALELNLASLPETKQIPKRAAVIQPQKDALQPKEKPRLIIEQETPPKPHLSVVPSTPPAEQIQQAVKEKNADIPNDAELKAARQVLWFLCEQVDNGRRALLSKQLLCRAIGNGVSLENVGGITTRSLRIIDRYWRVPPDPSRPTMNEFIVFVSKRRHDLGKLGCTTFDDFVKILRNRDRSPDPVDLRNL